MAKAKKPPYVSKGQRPSIARQWTGSERTALDKEIARMDAYRKGKRAYITVDGPDTRSRQVRVLAKDVLGDPRKTRRYEYAIMKD